MMVRARSVLAILLVTTVALLGAVALQAPAGAVGGFTSLKDPVLSGVPRVGQTLTVTSPGLWEPATDLYLYQWYADADRLVGVDGTTLVLAPEHVGKAIAVTVFAYDLLGNMGSATSNLVGTVQAADGETPIFVCQVLPTISGTLQVGRTLTLTRGTWTPIDPAPTLTHEWLADGEPISGQTGTTLALTADLEGTRISVRETAKAVGVVANNAVSWPTAAIVPAGADNPPVAGGPDPVVIKNLTRPAISGKAKVGRTLKASRGTWSPGSGVAFRFQWYAGAKRIAKATKARFRLTRKQRGKRISVRVTAVLPGATAVTARSRPTARVKA